MGYGRYARNAVLYAALFGLLATTPAPVVYADTTTGSEQQEPTETTITKDVVNARNEELNNSIADLDNKMQTTLAQLHSEVLEISAMYYSEYRQYGEANQITSERIAAAQRVYNDTVTALSEADGISLTQEQLDTLYANINAQIEQLNAQSDAIDTLKLEILQIDIDKDILQAKITELEQLINTKRNVLTEENAAKYKPSVYNHYQTTLDNASTIILPVKNYLEQLEYTLRAKGIRQAAADHTLTREQIGEITTIADTLAKDLEAVDNRLSDVNTLADFTDNDLRVTRIELGKQLEKAKNYPPDIYTTYTPETFSVFQQCLADAQRVYDDGDAVREQIRAAKEALIAAMKGLVEADRAYSIIGNTYYYNVNSFGALGQDTIDDTAALQKALDQARAGVSVVINVPAGTYYISNVLFIQSNTTLNLDPNATIFRMDSSLSNNMLKNSDSNHRSTGYPDYTLSQNITVNGGIWNGGNIQNSTKSTNLIYFGHGNHITISNATIRNCHGSHALEFAGIQNGKIQNCTFDGFRFGNNDYTSEAVQLDICYKNGDTEWTPGFDLDKTPCRNIVIENCSITDYPRGIGSHHVLSGVPYENITIRNNTITRNSSTSQSKCVTGIFMMGAKNLKVNKNTVDGYSFGAWIRQSSKITVKKNTFKNNPGYHLMFDGNDVTHTNVRFTITKYKRKTKPLSFTAPTIKTGNMKTRGQTYKITKVKKTHSLKLKKKLKKNQKISFYGKDKYNNRFYQTYYISK